MTLNSSTNLVGVLWPVIDSAMVTLGIVHLSIWLRDRRGFAHLAFAVLTVASAAASMLELVMMQSTTVDEFATAQRWQHAFVFVMSLALICYMQLRLNLRQIRLALLAVGLRVATLVVNFTTGVSLHFAHIASLGQMRFLGSDVTVVARGTVNPWFGVAVVSNVALLLYMIDAMWSIRRRQQDKSKQLALTISGGLLFLFVIALVMYYGSVTGGVMSGPYAATPIVLLLILSMGYELGNGVVRASALETALVATNRELVDAGARMESSAEAGGLGTWEVDFEVDDVWLMKSSRMLLGMEASGSVRVEQFLRVLRPLAGNDELAALKQGLRDGGSIEHEQRFPRVGLNDRIVLSRGRMELSSISGSSFRGISIDVSERRFAEERFQQVFEAAPCAMFIADSHGVIERVNAKAEADFGYDRAELIGQCFDVLAAEHLKHQLAADRMVYVSQPRARPSAPREINGRRKNGTEIPLSLVLSSIRKPEGIAIVVVAQDISERVDRLARLQQERAFLRQVIDMAPNLLFAKDREGRFTLANQAVADFYGNTVDDLIGKTDADLGMTTETFGSFAHFNFTFMDTLSEWMVPETSVNDAAGNARWMQLTKRPLLQHTEKSDQVLVSAVDVTAQKKTDLELSRQRNELERLTRITMVSELSGSIAHELNQPLTAILSNAQAASRFLAMEPPNLDEVREILLDIVSDDRRAGEVIRGLRSMMTKGQRRHEAVDVNEVTQQVLRLLNSDMLNASVRLTTHFAPALPPIICDRVQLQQILLNLLLNGCDAMNENPPDQRRLLVTTALDGESGVVVCVSDAGHGVGLDDLERVFDSFYTTKSHGLGLGLSVCRQIVAAHGGRLWATNNESGGAAFSFTLPHNATEQS